VSSRDAESRAAEVLRAADVTEAPIPVERVAAAQGAQIVYETLDGDVSGLLFRDQARRVIGVNSRHPLVRQRFTIAHEIGHLVMHPGRPVFIDRLVRVNARDGTTSAEEVDANSFAAALLMPGDMVEKQVSEVLARNPQSSPEALAGELAGRFLVSAEAMGYRLMNLGVLDPDPGL
jgi:Zn-dependent peptidase ImmA (M78 family)